METRTPHSRTPWLLALLGLTLATTVCGDIQLVQDGASGHEIVLAEESLRAARLAAKELQTFVERSTGAKLPITATPSPDKHHVYVGPNQWSQAAGVSADDLPPEGFRIRTAGADLHVVGSDSNHDPKTVRTALPAYCGTVTGVFELLERTIGLMFCWHDDLGTVVPRTSTVTVPDLDITAAPDWSYRALAYSPEGATRALFGRRLRLGHSYTTYHAHAWHRILPVEKYGEEHPEYFAEIDGKRQARYYLSRHGGQVCTTNPDVVRIFADAAIAYFNKLPWRHMFSVSPNDGGGFCQCAPCRALDVQASSPDHPDTPVLTDRLLTFYNAIAQRLVAVHPDKTLGAYVYSYYKTPPQRVKPHPAIALVHATNSAHTHGVNWAAEHADERAWLSLSKRFYKYDIYYYGRSSLNLIAPVTTHLIEKLKAEQEAGIRGGYLYIGQSYEQLGAGHYLMARLMWDRHADARALERDYYSALYGPAGPDAMAYYHLLEKRLRKMHLEGIDVDEPAVEQLREAKSAGASAACVLAGYWPVLDQASALVERAATRELSAPEQDRLQRLADQHELLVWTVRGMIAAGRLETQASFDPDDVALLKQAVETREAVKKRIAVYAPTLAEYIARGDGELTARVTPEGAFYRLSRRNREPTLVALKAARPPVVDGKPDEGIWRRAPRTYMLLTRTGRTPSLGARCQLAFDDGHLYMLAEGSDSDTAKLLRSARDREDTALFNEDNVELFLQPLGTAYYHIGIGAGSALFDSVHPTGEARESSTEWESGARFAVQTNAAGWSVEAAIPFASLGAGPGTDGPWRGNVYRTRRGTVDPDEYMAAAPTFGGYHVPERFARIVFADEPPATSLRHGTFDFLTPGDAADRVRFQGRGGARLALATEQTYCGGQALMITVPEGGLGGFTLTAPAHEEAGYRIVLACRNHVEALNPAVRPSAPITRVIFRGDDGKAVTPTTGYSWDGAPAQDTPDQWRTVPHIFTTPAGTTSISFTVFLHHPGTYWIDEARLESM